ncbi:hypothetical protein JCM1841_002768 [Sporobolomyces salmonicolor]
MSSHSAYLLREFFLATHWYNVDNHYASFTHPSRQLLDFAIQPGLHLSLASNPTRNFASGLALSSLVPETPNTYPPTTAPVLGPPVSPLLAGQLTYLFSSAPVSATSTKRSAVGDERIRFKHLVQSFGTEAAVPQVPELREDVRPTWQRGERVDKAATADFLLYGRLYAPSPRLDALYVHRLSATAQALVSLITVPSPAPPPTLSWQNDDPATSAAAPTASGTAARLSELELKLQQDTGRWSAEYSYAVGDGMWGVRGLYNFGRWGSGLALETAPTEPGGGKPAARERVVDEEDELPTGLKGRWSAGGEVYFSAQERSAGLSTGLRFTTLPESAGGPAQPPTTLTATLNPIMGQLSTAYAVQTGKDSSLASRFDFNLYSYDADLTVGGEWFQRRGDSANAKGHERDADEATALPPTFDAFGRGGPDDDAPEKAPARRRNHDAEDEITAVLKVRASTNSDVAMLWEGRLGDFLVSLGLVADLRLATQSRGRVSPIRSVGVGISYWA